MRWRVSSLLLVLLLSAFGGRAQKADTLSLRQAMNALNKALVLKDTKTLDWLLHERLSYGHSNGWTESKKEVIANLQNGKLSYERIQPLSESMAIDGHTGIVRMKGNFEVLLEAQPIALKLSVLQVWTWKKRKGWVLMSRQSVKVEH